MAILYEDKMFIKYLLLSWRKTVLGVNLPKKLYEGRTNCWKGANICIFTQCRHSYLKSNILFYTYSIIQYHIEIYHHKTISQFSFLLLFFL